MNQVRDINDTVRSNTQVTVVPEREETVNRAERKFEEIMLGIFQDSGNTSR